MRICSSSICALGPQACGLGGLVSDAVMNKQELEVHFHLWAVVKYWLQFSSIQFSHQLSHIRLFATPWTAARQASLSITNFLSILSLMSIELVMSSNHLILCCSFSIHLQSFPASGSYPMSQFFTSGGQSPGASASASVLPMNIQG